MANRPISYVDTMPAIILTQIEEDQLRKQRENTLIMKFSSGMPNLYEIRSHIHTEWNLERPPAVGVIDQRHVTLHMASPADTKRALARTTNKIKTSMFRLFRWTPEFEIGRDSSLAAVWVKMTNLPLHYFNESSLIRLGSILGTVLGVHQSTKNLTQQKYAKVCVELDVSKPLLDKLWIGTSKEYGWEVSLQYEGNNAYCDYCGLLGHTLGLCRKKRDDQGKAVATDGTNRVQDTKDKPRQYTGNTARREQWVEKSREADMGMAIDKTNNAHDTIPNNNKAGTSRMELTPMLDDILSRDQGNGISEEVRHKLLKAGLITEVHNENDPNQARRHENHYMHHEEQEKNSELEHTTPPIEVGNSQQKSTRAKSVTPVANKFFTLAPDEEVHVATDINDEAHGNEVQESISEAERRQRKILNIDEQNLIRGTELANTPRQTRLDGYNSDGSGSKSRSNMGVPFIHSDDDTFAATTIKTLPPRATKLAAAKRIKQSIKDKQIS